MKKIAWIILIFVIGCGIFALSGCSADDIADADKIEKVIAANKKVIETSALASLGDQSAWHQFDMRIIHKDEREFFAALRKELGDDFNVKLSTNEYITVKVLPFKKKFKVYAGNPAGDDSNMLYPEWKYAKISQ